MMKRDYRHVFVTPTEETCKHLNYIESAGHYCCDKSFYESNYYTSGYYLIYVTAGSGYVSNDGPCRLVRPNKVVFLDLSKPYKYYSNKRDPWEFNWLLLNGKDVTWFYQKLCVNNTFIFDIDRVLSLREQFELIYNINKHGDAFCEISTSNLIYNILTQLYIAANLYQKKRMGSETEYPDAIKMVFDYIEQNYFKKITLQELSKVTFLSPSHLLRQFKKYTGTTPQEYLNLYRLNMAKKLLLAPELTAEQIALNVGYCSASYFGKKFKEYTGDTPDKFRVKHQKQ